MADRYDEEYHRRGEHCYFFTYTELFQFFERERCRPANFLPRKELTTTTNNEKIYIFCSIFLKKKLQGILFTAKKKK